ncbi:HlyD family efflux transporter periplasmic adaptor subunit, partial [candidate division KSB1 bacterium]|nr:HlyD family efflux transporter periplasmic adaptor subunit [candidate division KSB1 bacterium]NIT72292.1 HlyD family efflux transporter periplasmic adaptor subunit [candidate division KSB1 bacterium]NIW70464.1 HlyD family efflux transporter periplasmic adaptor subunit [candidate division KSB1 bacterium]NIX71972.1 HlyD family efflux transporter periplasmic adaptor subunit [candidate division KSB1 bacterium]
MTINAKAMLLPIGILIAGGLAMWILLSFRSEPERRKPAPRQKIVESEVIELKDVPSEINAYGRLTSAQPVVLYSEVPGTLMEGNVSFQPGQSFRNGDLLIRVDGRQARLDLNSAKSDLLTALASVLPEIKVDFPEQFQVWQDYFNRIEFGTTIPRLPEVKDQKIKLFLSRFNVYKLYFSVRNLEIRLEKHAIYAPFDGAIVSAELRPGSTVRNGSRLGEIINLENLEMRVPVQVQDIRWIDQRKPVQITSKEIGDQWSGRIERIGKAIDPQTQTVEVY